MKKQKAMLEQNIQMALSKGDINLEDAIDIREIRNLKLANQLLKMKRISKQEQEQKQAMAQQQAQAQAQQQSQEMAAQMAVQKIQMETKAKIEYRQADVMFEIEKMKNEAMYKSQLMQEEFNLNMQLRGVDVEAKTKVDKQKEDAKAERIGIQNTQQSKLIQQRKNNLPPINFESNEDSLDGFDFAEFNPR